jgi:hypothetical protein
MDSAAVLSPEPNGKIITFDFIAGKMIEHQPKSTADDVDVGLELNLYVSGICAVSNDGLILMTKLSFPVCRVHLDVPVHGAT